MAETASPPRLLDRGLESPAIQLVRLSVESWVTRRVRPNPQAGDSLRHVQCPLFVSLEVSGHLRGCVGSLEAGRPLGESLVDCAIAASSKDSRFPPILSDELPDLGIEISLLTTPRSLADPEEIRIGVDGLVVEISDRRGVLLPQVAARQGWDRETFLDQTCLKAGGRAGDWRRGCRIWRFQAQVIGEDDPT